MLSGGLWYERDSDQLPLILNSKLKSFVMSEILHKHSLDFFLDYIAIIGRHIKVLLQIVCN